MNKSIINSDEVKQLFFVPGDIGGAGRENEWPAVVRTGD